MSQILSVFTRQKKPFEETISPHMNSLFKVAFQYTGNQHDAEDLLQDLLTYLFTKQDEMSKVDKIKPWLMRCLYHRFVDMYRKKQRQPQQEDFNDDKVQSLFKYFDNHLKAEQHDEIYNALNSLSPDQRALVSLHDINGYTLVELSEIMSTPLGTLKSSLHRARTKLKKRITLQPSELSVRQYE